MSRDISSMQSERRKGSRDPAIRNGEGAKRTTIILEKEEREYIDSLIREGKEPGIKQLVSKMLEVYKGMMIYDWRFPGEYYCGISRIAFINIELLSILIQQIPREKWQEIGKTMGVALKVSFETTLGLEIIKRDNWESVFNRLRVQGFGDLVLKDKYLFVKTPFITQSEIFMGILEGLLDVKLDSKTTVPPLIFEVKRSLESSTTR
jgi:hypothetical protein